MFSKIFYPYGFIYFKDNPTYDCCKIKFIPIFTNIKLCYAYKTNNKITAGLYLPFFYI